MALRKSYTCTQHREAHTHTHRYRQIGSSLIDSTLQATNEDIFQASNLYPSVLASVCECVLICICLCVFQLCLLSGRLKIGSHSRYKAIIMCFQFARKSSVHVVEFESLKRRDREIASDHFSAGNLIFYCCFCADLHKLFDLFYFSFLADINIFSGNYMSYPKLYILSFSCLLPLVFCSPAPAPLCLHLPELRACPSQNCLLCPDKPAICFDSVLYLS